MEEIVERYQAISEKQNEAALKACSTDLAACQEHSLAAANGEYARYGDDSLWDLPSEALPYMQALFDENIGVQNQFGEATIARNLMEGAGLSPERAALLAAMPTVVGVLRAASRGKGNFGLGSSTREEADLLGRAWVGEGYKVASDGKTLISQDGMRQYRPPTYKSRLGITQANFERKIPGQESRQWQSNGHLDITD